MAQTWVPRVRRGPWTWIAFFGGILKASFPQHQLPFLPPTPFAATHPQELVLTRGKRKEAVRENLVCLLLVLNFIQGIHCLHSMQRFLPLATEIKALGVHRPKSQQIFPTPDLRFWGVRHIPIEPAESSIV
jgi:hypothetical protein